MLAIIEDNLRLTDWQLQVCSTVFNSLYKLPHSPSHVSLVSQPLFAFLSILSLLLPDLQEQIVLTNFVICLVVYLVETEWQALIKLRSPAFLLLTLLLDCGIAAENFAYKTLIKLARDGDWEIGQDFAASWSSYNKTNKASCMEALNSSKVESSYYVAHLHQTSQRCSKMPIQSSILAFIHSFMQ